MKKIYRRLTIAIVVLMIVQPVGAFEGQKSSENGHPTLSKTPAQESPLAPVAYEELFSEIDVKPSSYAKDEILIKYKTSKVDLDTASGRLLASNFIRSESLNRKEHLLNSNISVVHIEDGKTVEQKISELEKNPIVEYAQPNFQYYATTIDTSDTKKDLLWGLDNTGQTVNGGYTTNNPGTPDSDIDAPEAWAIHQGEDTIVALIDDGVAYNHPDLLPNMWDGVACKDANGNALGGCEHGYDFADEDKVPLPTNGSHGTHIAGTIAAVKDNAKGIIGVAPQAKIMAIKSSLTTSDNVKSIQFATQNGAHVINASWAGTYFDQILKDSIATFPGLFVAAAGNGSANNESVHSYPSDYDLENIISVAATDQDDELATFSNYGATSVDVGAPGTNIYSTASLTTDAFSESFESVTPPAIPVGWVLDGTAHAWGTYQLDGGEFWGKVLYGDLAYPYADSANTFATSPTIDLSSGGANIDFWTQCDTQYETTQWVDYMQLEYSVDGVHFSVATDPYSGEEFRWDEAVLDILNGDPLDSTSAAIFHYEQITIPAEYQTNTFKVRFRWVSNAEDDNYDGCLIDDMRITTFSDGADEHYAYGNGTSMATPHVTALAALIRGYNPSLTTSEIKNFILTTGDSVASLSGKTVSGKRINAQKALEAITITPPPDTTAPVLVLLGSNPLDLTVGNAFTEPGYTATDNIDGDLTSNVIITGSVDANVVGMYTLTYSVGDAAANTTSVNRVVNVNAAPTPPPSSGGGGGGGGSSSRSTKKAKALYSVTINKGARETSSRAVTLTLTPAPDASQIQISNTPNFTKATWTVFKETSPWTLTPNVGQKTVYVRYGKNSKVVGNAKDTIRLTAQGPVSLVIEPVVPTAPSQVLGVATGTTFSFTKTLSLGSSGIEVTELQKILIALKHLGVFLPTGYYGPMTEAAVTAYQKAHGLTGTGVVDIGTRAVLNNGSVPIASDPQKAPETQSLQAKLLELIAQLSALKAQAR